MSTSKVGTPLVSLYVAMGEAAGGVSTIHVHFAKLADNSRTAPTFSTWDNRGRLSQARARPPIAAKPGLSVGNEMAAGFM